MSHRELDRLGIVQAVAAGELRQREAALGGRPFGPPG